MYFLSKITFITHFNTWTNGMALTPGSVLSVGKASNAADSKERRNACNFRVSVSASTVRDVDATCWDDEVDGPAVWANIKSKSMKHTNALAENDIN